MSFLHPGLLAAMLPLLALPLLIHLFNRRYPHSILFPDLERLRRSLSERSKLARWRHVLMTMLRTLIIGAALMAFLRPVLPRFGSHDAGSASAGSRRVLLLVDRSLSMEHAGGTQPPASRQAVAEAGKILATLTNADTVNAILAGRQAVTALPEFSHRPDEVRAALAALPPSHERGDMPRAMAHAASMLGEAAKGTEVYVLSDFQRTNWADTAFDLLPPGVRLFFVNTAGESPRSNTALLSAVPASTAVAARDEVRLDVQAANYSPDPVRLPVEAIMGGHRAVSAEVPLAPWSTGRVMLTLPAPGEGIHVVEVRSPDDGLPQDNHRWVRLDVRRREPVLVISDESGEGSGAHFVTAALNPWDDQKGAFAPQRLTAGEVTPERIESVSKIILTGVKALPEDLAVRLAGFLENGGGLVYFLDGTYDGSNLAALEKATGLTSIPFRAAGVLTVENFGGAPQKIARGQFDSPFLRLFRGPNRQALSLLEFYRIQRALPTGAGEVLLHYTDGTPALGVTHPGLGTAVFCNFAPAELSSNLVRLRLFPAWLHDVVKQLTPESSPERSPEAGDAITAQLWQRDLEAHRILGPGGKPPLLKTAPDGDRVSATFTAEQTGIFSQKDGDRFLWAQAVNSSPLESDLRRMDTDEMKARATLSPAAGGHFVSGATDYAEAAAGRPVFHWFVLGAALFMVCEMLLFRPFQRASGHPS